VSWFAIGASLISVGLGGYAAFGIEIHDNIDTFISDLQEQSRWASYAAAAAGISVLLQVFEKLR
jgi:hypothetical protein